MATHFPHLLPGRVLPPNFLHIPFFLSSRFSHQSSFVDPITEPEPHVILSTVGTSSSQPYLTYQPAVHLTHHPTEVSIHGTLGVNFTAHPRRAV